MIFGSLPIVSFNDSNELYSTLDGTISGQFEIDFKDIVANTFALA